MANPPLTFEQIVRLVIDTLEVTSIEYLIGGAVALAAWGEARTTRDLDVVINLPGHQIVSLSRELAQRDMLVTLSPLHPITHPHRAARSP